MTSTKRGSVGIRQGVFKNDSRTGILGYATFVTLRFSIRRFFPRESLCLGAIKSSATLRALKLNRGGALACPPQRCFSNSIRPEVMFEFFGKGWSLILRVLGSLLFGARARCSSSGLCRGWISKEPRSDESAN